MYAFYFFGVSEEVSDLLTEDVFIVDPVIEFYNNIVFQLDYLHFLYVICRNWQI